MDYLYENLGPERFQQFCQALLVKEFPKLQCLPVAQPDGGRDAFTYFFDTKKGFIVFQVKYVRQPKYEVGGDLHKWLTRIVEAEAPKINNLIPSGAKEFYLLTNVPGTAHLESGSIDKVQGILNTYIQVPAHCWWRDDLNRRLDNAWDLKWTYLELTSGTDILRYVMENGILDDKQRRTDAITAYIQRQYLDDQEVRFKQVELRNKLLAMFIDVPVSLRNYQANPRVRTRSVRELQTALNYVSAKSLFATQEDDAPEWNLSIDQALLILGKERFSAEEITSVVGQNINFLERRHGHICAASLLLNPVIQEKIPCLILEGAPGQGKSTIAQYICQVHRMRILQETSEIQLVPSDHQDAPVRIPFKVDLRDYATWVGRQNPFLQTQEDRNTVPEGWNKSLESFLAAQVSNLSGGFVFTVADLHAVVRVSSILIVLDGFDEVVDIARREEIVSEVTACFRRLKSTAASLQIIVTSRPAAFLNATGFPEETFPHFELDVLTKDLIEDYANKWIKVNGISATESKEVKAILSERLDQPHLRDLARNPMQLAILLSLIHSRGASLPDKRTALYDSYIDLFFNREAEKNSIVRNNRDLLINVHRYLAWVLHSEAEETNPSGLIPIDKLRQLLSDYLQAEDYSTTLASDLFVGTTQRVGALVSRVEGTFEFEVQPLREYFAARFLYETAPYSPTGQEHRGTWPDRFHAIARNSYWLNVARFFAGCLSKGELADLVNLVKDLFEDEGFKSINHPRLLASMLLADWVFAQQPRSMREIVRLVLDERNLRYILNSKNPHRSNSALLALPKELGNHELVDRCVGILNGNISYEYAQEIIELLKANLSPDELTMLWETETDKLQKSERTKWFRYGYYMDVISELSVEHLEKVLSDDNENQERLRIILLSGQFSFCEDSETRSRAIVDAILDGNFFLPFSIRKDHTSVLALFSNLLDYRLIGPNRHIIASRVNESMYLVGTDLRDHPSSLPFWPKDMKIDFKRRSNVVINRCLEFIDFVKDTILVFPNPNTYMELWERILEKSRTIWGERWIHYILANNLGREGKKNNGDNSPQPNGLLDDSVPLYRRVIFARTKSQSLAWWKTQLGRAASELEAMFVCLSLLTWANVKVIATLSEDLNILLNSLPATAWRNLFRSLRDASIHKNINIDMIPNGLSERTISAIGLCSKMEFAVHLYHRYLEDYTGSDDSVLEFCQMAAIYEAKENPQSLHQSISLISNAYNKGILAPIPGQFSSDNLPIILAKQIAADPSRYPRYFVTAAEIKCRQSIISNVTPISEIAKREQWFTS